MQEQTQRQEELDRLVASEKRKTTRQQIKLMKVLCVICFGVMVATFLVPLFWPWMRYPLFLGLLIGDGLIIYFALQIRKEAQRLARKLRNQ